jgi:hypothetical protein
MGGPKGPKRGPKTHRADQKLNRGERKPPKPDFAATDGEEHESRHQEQVREEHPTRMTEAGYRSRHGNRR